MPPPPMSKLLKNAIDQRDTAATSLGGDRAIAQHKLTAAEKMFQRQRSITLKMEKEIAAIAADDHKTRRRAYKEYEEQIKKLNKAQEEYTDTLERSLSVTQRFGREVARNAGAQAMAAIGTAATAMAAQTRAAYTDMIQTQRKAARDTGETTGRMMDSIGNYNRMLLEASQTALRYGMSTQEVLQTQRGLVQGLNADITDDSFIRVIEHSSDQLGYLSARTGHATGELTQFTNVALRAFGRGTQQELEAFTSDLTAASHIPSILREEMAAANNGLDEFGATFSNEETMRMLMEWTTQFGDQATNITEMAAAMGTFRRRAAEAGNSVQTINRMQSAMTTGIAGRQGDDANSLLGGRILRQRIREAMERDREQGGTSNADQFLGNLNAGDRSIVQDRLMNTNHGLADVDLMRMLQGTAEGMDAMMEGLVGIGGSSGDISITRRMLREQGISTGTDQDDLRLAELVMQRGQGEMVDPEEVRTLMDKARDTEARDAQSRQDVYRNVGAINETVATMEENITGILGNVRGIFDLIRSGGRGPGGGGGDVAGSVFAGSMASRLLPLMSAAVPVLVPMVMLAAAGWYINKQREEREARRTDALNGAYRNVGDGEGGTQMYEASLFRNRINRMNDMGTGYYSDEEESSLMDDLDNASRAITLGQGATDAQKAAAIESMLTKIRDEHADDNLQEDPEIAARYQRIIQLQEALESGDQERIRALLPNSRIQGREITPRNPAVSSQRVIEMSEDQSDTRDEHADDNLQEDPEIAARYQRIIQRQEALESGDQERIRALMPNARIQGREIAPRNPAVSSQRVIEMSEDQSDTVTVAPNPQNMTPPAQTSSNQSRGPVQSVAPARIRLNQNGDAVMTVSFVAQDFAGAVSESNEQNNMSQSPGMTFPM